MTQIIVAYIVTAAVFLIADAIMLTNFMKPLFVKHLGDAVLESPRFGPAAVFYLFYIAGAIWLVSWPAIKVGDPTQALINGAILGAMAYGTYEFTSYAVMRDWSFQQVMVDGIWGTVLTGVSVWAGVLAARSFA
ncbi:DUF2177 family protein [Oceaniglobus ichthyenteri]|uniref:DUF2177 family protein n=1 Tax=Oceaniglobus ichthyenteri TaxID=2136177 RepID=UPI000D34D9B0|nr:DUF2177 family protein [Oceaniglobus ichthyenteri]